MKKGNRLSTKAPELVSENRDEIFICFFFLAIQLAHYCDSLLRKSTKTASENEIEEKLNHAITIFNYLDDKDYFQRVNFELFNRKKEYLIESFQFYQKMLARRLINQQSASMDAEEFMVTKLKVLHDCF